MRNIFKCAVFSLTACTMVACGDLYETHKEYLQMAEETYIGLADSLTANGGFNRVELKWKLSADPRMNTCVITWNGSKQPLEVAVDRSKDYMSKVIDLPEGKYIFKVVVRSDSGKESLASTTSGESYGAIYQARLPQRSIASMSANPDDVTIKWAAEEKCVGVNLTYESTNGTQKTLFVKEKDESTFISDYVPGSNYTLTSVFKPEKDAIDEIAAFPETLSFPSYFVISKIDWNDKYHQRYQDVERTGWTAEATTEETSGEGAINGRVATLLDGNYNTFWHSKWSGGATPALPHLITIDMQQEQKISSIELARRKDNKDVKTVEYSISNNKENWTKLGIVKFPDNKDPNAIVLLLPEAVTGRYIRATVSESNNGVNASLSEILFTSDKK